MTLEGSVRHIERDIRGEGKASCGSKPRRGTLLGAGPVHREAQVHEAGGEGGGCFPGSSSSHRSTGGEIQTNTRRPMRVEGPKAQITRQGAGANPAGGAD